MWLVPKRNPHQFEIMDLVLQLHLLIPQLAQLLWQVLDQEPVDEDVDEDGGEDHWSWQWWYGQLLWCKCLIKNLGQNKIKCSFINNKETTTRSQSLKVLYKIFLACTYFVSIYLFDLVTAAELESSPRAFWTLSRPVGSSPVTSSSSSSSFQRNIVCSRKKISSSPLAPREEAQRERDCQAGEARSVGGSAGRMLPGEAPEVAGPENHFSI